jgi:hypothetical protein
MLENNTVTALESRLSCLALCGLAVSVAIGVTGVLILLGTSL